MGASLAPGRWRRKGDRPGIPADGPAHPAGEGGRGGHLAGVLRGGAVTVPRRQLPHRGAVSFWDWTAPLRSHCPHPFPQALVSPPPTCALTTTLHSIHQPPPQGPRGPESGAVSFDFRSQRPLTHAPDFPPSCSRAAASPLPQRGDLAGWALGFGVPSKTPTLPSGFPLRGLGGLPWP